jgi:lysophospholipase L1-like esterase
MTCRNCCLGTVALFATLASLPPANSAEPKLTREAIEWCDVWISNADKNDLPRVLLIGDSITRGYYSEVEKRLAGKAYVARLATSRFVADPVLLAEVAVVLGSAKFDIIHFNNGLHGMNGYTEDDYRQHLPELLATIRQHAPKAKLILALSTPMRKPGQLAEFAENNERVKARNRIATELAAKEHISIDDLFSLVEPHQEFWSNDGVHYNGKGTAAEGEQVASEIAKLLPN